jgi:IS5 family transposase
LVILRYHFFQFHPRNALFSWSFVERDLMSDTADFFRSRLDQMIDLRHPLAVLSSRMPWQELEASVSHLFAKKVRAGKVIDEADFWRQSDRHAFRMPVQWVNRPNLDFRGFCGTVAEGTARPGGQLAHLPSKTLGLNEIARVNLSTSAPVVFEPYTRNQIFGQLHLG